MSNNILQKPKSLLKDYPRKGGSALTATHYCAGCGHGIVHKLIGEAMDELGIQDRCVMISPVGCAVFAYYYFDCGNVQTAHGRAPAVATGISRASDDAIVMSYQGDGDLASIGLNETLQAANRGEKIAVFFINNTVYGMTGGQMAPTTLIGEKTITSPNGRDPHTCGYPLHMCELIDQLMSPVYIERVSLADVPRIRKAKKAITRALEVQREGKGYSFVEILSPCPTNLRMDAKGVADFVINQMEKEFPVGCLRDKVDDSPRIVRDKRDFSIETLDKIFNLKRSEAQVTQKKDNFKTLKLKLAGFGGQGVLSMGLMFAHAACADERNVSWFPSYGPEQRGGTSNCSVTISGESIGSPVINDPDVLVALNRPSLEKFAEEVKTGGIIFYDSTIGDDVAIPEGVTSISVPAFELARDNGSAKALNTAMTAVLAFSGVTGIALDKYEQTLEENFAGKARLIDLNKKVFTAACEWAKQNIQGGISFK